MEAIFQRTSVRSFEDKEIEKEKIAQILKAAMQAPTAVNQKSWEFYVVRNKDLLQQLATASPYAGVAAYAPLAIVIAYHKESLAPEYAQIDCAIAVENIWLEATSLGLGAVMLGIAPEKERMDRVHEVLDLPKDQEAFTIIPIGYPKGNVQPKDHYNPDKIHYFDE